MRLLFILLSCLLPVLATAQSCGTNDLRKTLTPAQSAAIEAELVGQPYLTGNHWIATRGDDTLHLIGTVHVFDKRLEPIAGRLRSLVATADRMLVEATPDAEAKLQAYLAQTPELIRIQGPSLIDRLPEDDWQALANAARARGIPSAMAAQMQPWYLSLTLAIPPCIMGDMMAGSRGLDHMLMEMATESGIPLIALESWRTVIDASARKPIEEQLTMLRLGVIPPDLANDMMVSLMAQYFEERHAEVFPLNRAIARDALNLPAESFDPIFNEMLEALLFFRNQNWLPAILDARGTTIIAVGAGHLGGTGGLLDLLASEGFTLTRAPF